MSALTADRIDPAIIAQIRANSERVIVKTDAGYKPGVRSTGIFMMFNCLGRMTLTDDGEVYHSMVGSQPTFNRIELEAEVARLQTETTAILTVLPSLL